MANDFYDHTGTPGLGAPLSSATIRAEFDEIENGFGKMPGLTGNGLKKVRVNSAGTALEAALDNLPTAALATLDPADVGQVVRATADLTVLDGLFASDDRLYIYNTLGTSINLVQGSGMTLYLSGNVTPGSRVIGPKALVMLWFPSAHFAVVTGQGAS